MAQRPISCRAAIGPASFPRGRLAIGLVPALEPGPPPASGLPSVRVSVRALAIDRGNFPRDPATIGPESATAIAREHRRQSSEPRRKPRAAARQPAAARGEIGDQIRDNHPRLDFWLNNPNSARWRINAPYRWAAWGALTGWFGWGSGYTETAYAYGENVYYGEDEVYYGDQPVATAEEYANQAAAIVGSAPENLDPQASEWMPLGVFALTEDNQAKGPTPTMYFQLAVDKSGVISGTFQNMATGESQTLEGKIDKQSQRTAWGVQGKAWPIMETGLSNLTQDTVPVLVHFADGQTQQMLLVRLDEPKATAAPAPSGG